MYIKYITATLGEVTLNIGVMSNGEKLSIDRTPTKCSSTSDINKGEANSIREGNLKLIVLIDEFR